MLTARSIAAAINQQANLYGTGLVAVIDEAGPLPADLLRGERATLFNIDAASYDLWRGNTYDVPEVNLMFHPWRRFPRPRTPGSIHRQRCEVEVLRDSIEAAGCVPFWDPHPRAPVQIRVPSIFDRVVGSAPRESVRIGQRYWTPVDLDLSPAQGFTYAAARRSGKSEAMRVVAMDLARREITFTQDAVYERPLPAPSRVPAGLQKHRLDGRRRR